MTENTGNQVRPTEKFVFEDEEVEALTRNAGHLGDTSLLESQMRERGLMSDKERSEKQAAKPETVISQSQLSVEKPDVENQVAESGPRSVETPREDDPVIAESLDRVSRDEFLDFLEIEERRIGRAAQLNERLIPEVPVMLGVTERVYAKLAHQFGPKRDWKRKPKNELFTNECRGVLRLSEVTKIGEDYGYVITDYIVEEVGDELEVAADDNPTEPGWIEFHSHVLPEYLDVIDIGDLINGVAFSEFVEVDGKRSSGKRLFALFSVDQKREDLRIKAYLHDMTKVKKKENGRYTFGLSKLKSAIVVDLKGK